MYRYRDRAASVAAVAVNGGDHVQVHVAVKVHVKVHDHVRASARKERVESSAYAIPGYAHSVGILQIPIPGRVGSDLGRAAERLLAGA